MLKHLAALGTRFCSSIILHDCFPNQISEFEKVKAEMIIFPDPTYRMNSVGTCQ